MPKTKPTRLPSPLHRYVLGGLLGLLVVTGLFIRLWQLSVIPVGLYHDELDHVFTGEAVARYGTDITGAWSPWQLRPLQTINYTAELPPAIHAATQLVAGFGAGTAHVPNALFGLATVVVAGVLAWIITQRKEAGVLTGIILLLSPWHIFISRMTYEATISLFFQVVFITSIFWILQRAPVKPVGKIAVLSIVALSFFLGFFTYHGAKLSLLAVGCVSLAAIVIKAPTRFWRWSVSILLLLLMIGGFGHTLYLNHTGAVGGRLQNELLTKSEFLEKIVNDQRRLSLLSPATRFFANKPTVLIQEGVKHYFSVFDIQRLFITGYESGFQFSLIVHGFFYLSGLVLIPLGMWWVWRRQRSMAILLLAFLVVSPIASSITIGYQSVFRSALTYVLLLLLAGFGLTALVDWLLTKRYGWLLSAGVLLLLWVESVWFGYHYLSRYPILTADNHYFSEKLLAGYARHAPNPLIIVVDNDAYTRARTLVTYNGLMPQLSETEKTQFADPSAKDFYLAQTRITTDCPDLSQNLNSTWAVDPSKWETCGYKAFLATASAELTTQRPSWLLEKGLASPLDSHAYYVVLNDSVCAAAEPHSYVYAAAISDYDTTHMSAEAFCKIWLVTTRQFQPIQTPDSP